ncbi:hypothetical protein A4X03_0g6102, partial [Tilletia caries]
FSTGSDDSDTVLGPRFSTTSTTRDGPQAEDVADDDDDEESIRAAAEKEVQRTRLERERRARERRQLCAKYNLDATSLVLLGLQARAQLLGDQHHQLGMRMGDAETDGEDEVFHYLSRAWRAALSPIATCLLVEEYLPLLKTRTFSSSTESSDADVDEYDRRVGVETTGEGEVRPVGKEKDGEGCESVQSETTHLQHSSDTLRSPKSSTQPEPEPGTTSPILDQPIPKPQTPADSQRESLIALLGGQAALGRLYLSYARLHLDVSVEKWTSPLAFPAEAGQLHGPYASSGQATAVGELRLGGGGSPGGVAAAGSAGGALSPGHHFSAGGAGAGAGAGSQLFAAAGLGLGPGGGGGGSGWHQGGWEGRASCAGGAAHPAPSSSARSPSSVHSGRTGSHSPCVPLGGPLSSPAAPSSSSTGGGGGDPTSTLVFASHERERTLRRRPGPLAYMQAAVRLDPTLATMFSTTGRPAPPLSSSSSSSNESSPCRPPAAGNSSSTSAWPLLLPGESGAQAWRMGMAVEEDEWTEAHEIEVERRAAIHQEARYRASLTRTGAGGLSWGSDGGVGSMTGTATPTTSSVPSSEVGSVPFQNHAQLSRGNSGRQAAHELTPGPRRSGGHKSTGGGRGSNPPGPGPSSSSRNSRKPHASRRHGGRSSMRRSTLPLISEEGMINIMSGAAVLSVVVAGSVAVMGWWRRAGGATGPGV